MKNKFTVFALSFVLTACGSSGDESTGIPSGDVSQNEPINEQPSTGGSNSGSGANTGTGTNFEVPQVLYGTFITAEGSHINGSGIVYGEDLYLFTNTSSDNNPLIFSANLVRGDLNVYESEYATLNEVANKSLNASITYNADHTGTANMDGDEVSIRLFENDLSNTPSSIDEISGVRNFTIKETTGGFNGQQILHTSGQFIFDVAGNIYGSTGSGCNFTGTVSVPNLNSNGYILDINIADCPEAGNYDGLGYQSSEGFILFFANNQRAFRLETN